MTSVRALWCVRTLDFGVPVPYFTCKMQLKRCQCDTSCGPATARNFPIFIFFCGGLHATKSIHRTCCLRDGQNECTSPKPKSQATEAQAPASPSGPVYTSSHSSVGCLCLRLLLIFKLDFSLYPSSSCVPPSKKMRAVVCYAPCISNAFRS